MAAAFKCNSELLVFAEKSGENASIDFVQGDDSAAYLTFRRLLGCLSAKENREWESVDLIFGGTLGTWWRSVMVPMKKVSAPNVLRIAHYLSHNCCICMTTSISGICLILMIGIYRVPINTCMLCLLRDL